MPPEEYGFDFDPGQENFDDFIDDEEAMEAMREMENESPKVHQISPEKKRPRFDSPPKEEQRPTLEEITNSIRACTEPLKDLENSYSRSMFYNKQL